MNFVRPSSLGVAEFCPRSAELNELSSIMREAVMSTAWHAKLAGNDTLIGELHPSERKEVSAYGVPETCELHWLASSDKPLAEPVVLDYESAEKELHVQVFDRDTLLTEGTLDFAWVREVDGKRWAFVGDLKRSTWAIPDGADTLQLAAYGHAYSVLRSCVGYTPGLWSGTDSDWTWGSPVDLTSPEALDLWLRLKRASANDWRLRPEGSEGTRHVTGAHCKSCYGRQQCPAYALLAHDGPVPEVTEENAAQLILRAQALSELAEGLKENVKTFAERGGVVFDPVTKKRFLPVQCKGRMGLDKEAAQKAGFDVTKFQKRGSPYLSFDWRKP